MFVVIAVDGRSVAIGINSPPATTTSDHLLQYCTLCIWLPAVSSFDTKTDDVVMRNIGGKHVHQFSPQRDELFSVSRRLREILMMSWTGRRTSGVTSTSRVSLSVHVTGCRNYTAALNTQ